MADKQSKEVKLALQYLKENREESLDVIGDATIEYLSRQKLENETQQNKISMIFKCLKDVILFNK
ncbi:hypothetical protein [Aureispira sp. CCB-E]|uniref:hypothetical protein n=1 Tax=Aureispira sp. CCB-E TaxID=3051121 RepID=UPI002868FDCB|nr:hypothetical protein [Aureispira sp. CCB-E]WMX17474.1 hypothetical protein QP953_13920 [Aureispira sp. CCB-E]